jgi:hypothetical protein
MSETLVNKHFIYVKQDYEFTKLNLPLAEAKVLYKHKVVGKRKWPWSKKPEIFIVLRKGMVLHSQSTPYTTHQLRSLVAGGYCYHWGFGPCMEVIPLSHIGVAEMKEMIINEETFK